MPEPQRKLWPELSEVPPHFVLYGGTALALRLGHRTSADFDFFTNQPVTPAALLRDLAFLNKATILQNVRHTLTVAVNRGGEVKVSFFGGLSLGRVGEPEATADGVLSVASLLDLAGTKAAVVAQRAESKDYIDLLALVRSGVSLVQAMAAAASIYGEQYNPLLTLKSLSYFGDGDLHKLTPDQKAQLTRISAMGDFSLPRMARASDSISPNPS